MTSATTPVVAWHGPSRYERGHPATGECIDYEHVCNRCSHHTNIGTSSAPKWRCKLAPSFVGPADEHRQNWPACTLYVRGRDGAEP